jgi:NAD/NADP transhydrogenase beta subunit
MINGLNASLRGKLMLKAFLMGRVAGGSAARDEQPTHLPYHASLYQETTGTQRVKLAVASHWLYLEGWANMWKVIIYLEVQSTLYTCMFIGSIVWSSFSHKI